MDTGSESHRLILRPKGTTAMKNAFEIAVFNGDGIGPEIMQPTLDILRDMAKAGKYTLSFIDAPAGADVQLGPMEDGQVGMSITQSIDVGTLRQHLLA